MRTSNATGKRAAGLLTNALNPFFLFTALYATVALTEENFLPAALLVGVELAAAGLVAGYVSLMRRRTRVSDFWISRRTERLVPALFLLATFTGLLVALYLLGAPEDLFLLTLSMGLAAAAVAAATLLWKASAHAAVAGHAAAAGPLLLGPWGLLFTLALPLVVWSRVTLGAHTLSQTLAGAAAGAGSAALFLA